MNSRMMLSRGRCKHGSHVTSCTENRLDDSFPVAPHRRVHTSRMSPFFVLNPTAVQYLPTQLYPLLNCIYFRLPTIPPFQCHPNERPKRPFPLGALWVLPAKPPRETPRAKARLEKPRKTQRTTEMSININLNINPRKPPSDQQPSEPAKIPLPMADWISGEMTFLDGITLTKADHICREAPSSSN